MISSEPQIAVQAKEHVEKCHQCIIFKAKQQKAPMESIVATHPLELVHIQLPVPGARERKGGEHPGGD